MMMLSLFLSLLASRLLLVTPFVIDKEQVENIEEPPSLEVNKTTDPKTPEAPWTNVEFPLAAEAEQAEQAEQAEFPFAEAEQAGQAEHDVDTCRKVSMYVNISELALSDEIIAPRGFDAFQCKGKCSSTQRKKFPNRLALMTLLQKKKGVEIDDEACCVPTKLAPISALVFEKNGHIVLKKLDDLVVEECGCE